MKVDEFSINIVLFEAIEQIVTIWVKKGYMKTLWALM